jgi:PAS domain S-box-containing protein
MIDTAARDGPGVRFRYELADVGALMSVEPMGAEEVAGYRVQDFLAGSVSLPDIVHADDGDVVDVIFSPTPSPSAQTANLRQTADLRQTANLRLRHVDGHIICFKATFEKSSCRETGVERLDLLLQDVKNLPRTMEYISDSTALCAMMENTTDFIFFKDKNHVFTGASHTLVALCHPSEHWTDILGCTDYDVFPEKLADLYYSLEKKVLSGVSIAQEIQKFETIDGRSGWVDNRKHLIKNSAGEIIGLYGIARDVTEQVNAQAYLKNSEEVYRSIVEGSDDLINVLDGNGVFRFVNHGSEAIYGRSPKDCIGLSYAEFVHKDDLAGTVQAVQQWVEEKRTSARYENRQVSADGTVRDVSWNIALHYNEQGEVNTIIAIGRDITETKKLERLRNEALEEAQRANRVKSEFLASMSHELRTPLNAILGFSEVLADQPFGPPGQGKYREYAKDIHNSGSHLLELVNDLLDIAWIESGNAQIQMSPVDIVAVVSASIRFVEVRSRMKGVSVHHDIAEVDAPLLADRRALTQALLNLLTNAVKFTPSGGEVRVSGTVSGESFDIHVTDNGPGMSAGAQANLFKPFSMNSNDPHITAEGWGLGLSITKSLVELQGGQLLLKSDLGRGTKATIRLPIS